MRIKTLILENFRLYKQRVEIPFSQLTCFIGKNDAGKSSILEALSIFFESGIKIDSDDASKSGNPKKVRIGVIFDDLPENVILDSNEPTTFRDEYLLNPGELLEIHKVYNCSLQSPKSTVFICANYPNLSDIVDVIQKNQSDLKSIVKSLSLEGKCEQTKNPSMRRAIYEHYGKLDIQPREISLDEGHGKTIWTSIQKQLPLFALFQSDRASNDQDSEVQDPMKVAVDKALSTLGSELDEITNEVKESVQTTAKLTLEKMSESYPELASTLTPKFKVPNWKSLFKIEFLSDGDVPLNKRGSGVRRLILLSFFQAEVERKLQDKTTNGNSSQSTIYAIEEPETSQHPNVQKKMMQTFLDISAEGDQIILTTHVPALAGLVPLESLRFIDHEPISKEIRVRDGTASSDVYREIADALGVFPNPNDQIDVKVVVLVEGKNDIVALKSMIDVLEREETIGPIDDKFIFWTMGGGDGQLLDWVRQDDLKKLKVPLVVIADSDRMSSSSSVENSKPWFKEAKTHSKITPFLTQKRNMDNYFNTKTLTRLTNGLVKIVEEKSKLDFDNMAEALMKALEAAVDRSVFQDSEFHAMDSAGKTVLRIDRKWNRKFSVKLCKRVISAYLIREMTVDELNEIATYTVEGKERNEIMEWIKAIQDSIDAN